MSAHAPLVLAIGDSLIAGHGLPRRDGFAFRLQERLGIRRPGAVVIDEGRSGDTVGAVLARLPPALTRLPSAPDLAIVQAGPNDVLRGVPPSRTRADLDAVLAELGRRGLPVLLTTVAPPGFLLDRVRGHLGIHEDLAAAHGATVHPFFPLGILGRADMTLADGVHPNAKAIRLVVDAMLPTVERLLETSAPRG